MEQANPDCCFNLEGQAASKLSRYLDYYSHDPSSQQYIKRVLRGRTPEEIIHYCDRMMKDIQQNSKLQG